MIDSKPSPRTRGMHRSLPYRLNYSYGNAGGPVPLAIVIPEQHYHAQMLRGGTLQQ